jgi:hypothetical protein
MRHVFGCMIVLAPLGWALFWAVFHTVPGQDWVVFHTAAARWRAGDMAMLGDPRAFTDEMNRSHAAWFAVPIRVLHPWVYPPVTLLLAIAFGWMAYPVSLVVFLAASGAAMVAALWPWANGARDRAVLIGGVLACPASAYMIGAGQLSFLMAAALLTGMRLLGRQPFLAGMAFSLLCLKPQLALLVPVALVAGRHWRAIGGAMAGGLALVAASALVAGLGAWVAWIGFASGANPMLGSMIDVVRTYDQSVHTCLRILGFDESVAGVGQIFAFLVSVACVWRIFARPGGVRPRLVVLLSATVFGAPHVGDYDEVLVAIAAMLLLIERRCVVLAAAAWLATLLNPPALIAVLGVPVLTGVSALTPLLVMGMMLVEVRKKALLF